MQWEYPRVLWSLVALPGLLYCAATLWRQKKTFWDAWCRLPYTRQQSARPPLRRHLLTTTLFLLGFTLSVLGFASPIVERTAYQPVWDNVALVILVDFSRSMEAPRDSQEVNAPSRFEETKTGLLEFLETLPPGVHISLVPFAENAIPITSGFSDDHSELTAKVRRFQRDFFYKQGTDLTTTLQEGFHLADTFTPTPRQNDNAAAAAPPAVTSLVLISDGDEPATEALQRVLVERGTNIPVFAIGVGSAEPVYIPEPSSPEGYLVDKHGNPVTTTLNAATLRLIAEKTGGMYYPFAQRRQLFAALQQIIETQGTRSQQAYTYPNPLRRFFFLGAFLLLVPVWKFERF